MKTRNFQIYKNFMWAGEFGTNSYLWSALLPFTTIDNVQFSRIYIDSDNGLRGATQLKLYKTNNTYSYVNTPNVSNLITDLWLGTDGTDNTVIGDNDYCENTSISPIASTDILRESISATCVADGAKYYITITATFKALADITVREIGLTKFMYTDDIGRLVKGVLLSRIVLDNEETYSANDVFTKTIVLEVD